jgi:hypothetical protein
LAQQHPVDGDADLLANPAAHQLVVTGEDLEGENVAFSEGLSLGADPGRK